MDNPGASPHYPMVPRTLVENLRLRLELYRMCERDRGARAALRRMCSEDLLFFVSVFVWTHDPRHAVSTRLPFIPYEFQEETFLEILGAIDGPNDLLIEKSRDMGASWMVAVTYLWCWMFREGNNFMLLSRKEEEVDKKGDEDSLFAKLDYVIDNLPSWLIPRHRRVQLHLRNHETGSTIDGRSTTGDSGRGGRRTSVFFDEFASVPEGDQLLSASADVTRCRIFGSTPKGAGNAFYRLAHETSIRKLRLHWSRHPVKARGMYYNDNGEQRSPWWDAEFERRGRNIREMAQEVEIDYLGSDYSFFDGEWLKEQLERSRPPIGMGRLHYNGHSGTWTRFERLGFTGQTEAIVRLWLPLDENDRMPRDRDYYFGCDIATGTGSSNSVLWCADEFGQQALEIAAANMKPHDFADLAVSLARWAVGPNDNPAWITWESNGPGQIFGDRVVEHHRFGHVYYRRNEQKIGKPIRDIPGHHSTRENKLSLFNDARRAMSERELTCLSRETLEECRFIVYSPTTNELMHSRSTGHNDPTGARDNHGDRATAMTICWLGMTSRKTRVVHDGERTAPIGSLQHRIEQRQREMAAKRDYEWRDVTEIEWRDTGSHEWR